MKCLAICVPLLLVTVACSSDDDDPVGPEQPPPGDTTSVVITMAGNIATCGTANDDLTATLLDTLPGYVFALGDNVVPNGTLDAYNNCYEPSWGRHKERTYAVLGNHEYGAGNADGAFTYFGESAGPAGLGYYSFDLGEWHIIVLNDNDAFVPYGPGSAQFEWLQADLAATTKQCTMALWHDPYFLSSNTAGFMVRPTRKLLWDVLYGAGVDVVVNSGQHHYERMTPMNPTGTPDEANGIRQFNVGTGGESLSEPTVAIHANSEARAAVYGVLTMRLRGTGYDWQFLAVPGASFTDSGSGTCH